MITQLRNFARSKWSIGLLGLLMLSLVVVGGAQTDVFASLGPQHVISAKDRSMNGAEFRTAMDRIRDNLQQEAQRPVTLEDMVAENIHTQFLETRTIELGFLAWAWDAGLRPGKDLVLKQIRGIPAFFNQVTGQFDQAQYEQVLGQQGFTAPQLEQEFRDQAAQEHFAAALFAGARAPRSYGALMANQALEARDGRWFLVTQAMAGAAPAPTDAQLGAFLNENAAQLRRPEFRTASLVLFSPSRDQATAIGDERIRERFEFRRAALSQPETRSFVTLTAPTREAAAEIAAALRAGQSAAQVGEARNIRPAPYEAQPRSAVADQAVAAAVFGLQAGQVSDPIQGGLGFTVAQVNSVTPGREATLETVRDAIVEELRAEDMRGQTYERVERYERERQEGKSLADAAQAVGARVVPLPPFTAEGRLPDGEPLNAPPQVFETAFGLAEGGESDVIDAGQGQYFAVRVNEITPAALPSLDQVRAPLAASWTQRENARRLSARAEALAAQVRGGQDIAEVARSAGATLVTRAGVQQNQETLVQVGQGVLQGLFGQGAGQVFSQPNAAGVHVVGHVDAVHAASADAAAPLAEQVRPRLTQDLTRAMIQTSVMAGAAKVGARNDPTRARAALGLTETAAPAAPR